MTTARRAPNREDLQIHQNLLNMARLVGEALERAADCLLSQNADLAQQVIDQDSSLNTLLRVIEGECLDALAAQHPVAADLRDIIASMQIAAELERVGDHAKDIAKIVLSMDSADFSGPMDRLGAMTDICVNMLVRVMEAYENRDDALACAAADEDRQVDELDEEAAASLMMQLMTQPDASMHATHLLWVAYHLERTGDRITNIAERVVFMVTGETPELG
jgi:phosphate transport system protein